MGGNERRWDFMGGFLGARALPTAHEPTSFWTAPTLSALLKAAPESQQSIEGRFLGKLPERVCMKDGLSSSPASPAKEAR